MVFVSRTVGRYVYIMSAVLLFIIGVVGVNETAVGETHANANAQPSAPWVDGRVYYYDGNTVLFFSSGNECGNKLNVKINSMPVNKCDGNRTPYYLIEGIGSGESTYEISLPPTPNSYYTCDSWVAVNAEDTKERLGVGKCTGENNNQAKFDNKGKNVALWWKLKRSPLQGQFNCEVGGTHIDVSLCPNYKHYANNPSASATRFFEKIFGIYAPRNAQEVVIRIPEADFYLYKPLGGDDIGIEFSNLTIEGLGNGPTFKPGGKKDRYAMIFARGGENLTIKNIHIVSDNQIAFSGKNSAAIVLKDVGGDVVLDNISCSGTKGESVSKGSDCVEYIAQDSNSAGNVSIKNSTFSDYYAAVSIKFAKSATVVGNTFDNSNPSKFHDRGNVDLELVAINKDGNGGKSLVRNNRFLQGSNYTHGETSIGLIGRSNNIEISGNRIEGTQDTGMYISSHVPGAPGKPNYCVYGAPRNIKITGNTIRNVKLYGIAVINTPIDFENEPNHFPCTRADSYMDGILISQNSISSGGGGIQIAASDHASIFGLEVKNNYVANMTHIQGANWASSAAGSCLFLGGLKGKNNDPSNIRIHDNTLSNCKVGIYLWAAFWPLFDHVNGHVGPGLALYPSHSRPNSYISVYSNTIDNYIRDYFDILYQKRPVPGVTDFNTIRLYGNKIIDSANTGPVGRCNSTCSSNDACLDPVPTLWGSATGVVPGYPVGYVCSSEGYCRNGGDLTDSDCDLNSNPVNAGPNPPAIPPDDGGDGGEPPVNPPNPYCSVNMLPKLVRVSDLSSKVYLDLTVVNTSGERRVYDVNLDSCDSDVSVGGIVVPIGCRFYPYKGGNPHKKRISILADELETLRIEVDSFNRVPDSNVVVKASVVPLQIDQVCGSESVNILVSAPVFPNPPARKETNGIIDRLLNILK